MAGLNYATARAVTPDQLLPYVAAVSAPETTIIASSLLHTYGDNAVLVAYPLHDPLDAEAAAKAIAEVLLMPSIRHISVLSASRPREAPPDATSSKDTYWQLPLPVPAPHAKLRNMLKRASQEVDIDTGTGITAWTQEHQKLAQEFIKNKASLDDGSRYLFAKIPDYLAGAPDALLFSGRRKTNGELVALTVGDYSALSTCFYMFAFRSPAAPPGVADLLLQKLAEEGVKRGHERLNLGLGINAGIEFFKKKWQAQKFLPYVETSWNIQPKSQKGFFARLFGR